MLTLYLENSANNRLACGPYDAPWLLHKGGLIHFIEVAL